MDDMLLVLAKVHSDDNSSDMMTKALPRGKFETCCDIAGLPIISTQLRGGDMLGIGLLSMWRTCAKKRNKRKDLFPFVSNMSP